MIKNMIFIIIFGLCSLSQAMQLPNFITIQYTVKNDSGRTLIANYQDGSKKIESRPEPTTFNVNAPALPASTINAYIAPLRFFGEGYKSGDLPLLLVNVNLRAPRGPEANTWTLQAWNENMQQIASWGAQGLTKNESMAVRIRIPSDIKLAEVDPTLISR